MKSKTKNLCLALLAALLLLCALAVCLLQAPLGVQAASESNLVYQLPSERFTNGGENTDATKINTGTLEMMGDGVSSDANSIQLNVNAGELKNGKDVWFAFDLGTQYELRHLYMDTFNRNNAGWLLFDLYVSSDGNDWTKLYEESFNEYENANGCEGAVFTDSRSGAPNNHKIGSIPLNCRGRYFRINYVGYPDESTALNNYSIRVYELELYGYSLESSNTTLDSEAKTVRVDADQTVQNVLDGLTVDGNAAVSYVDGAGQVVADPSRAVAAGDKIVVKDNMKSAETAAGPGRLGAASVAFSDEYAVQIQNDGVTVTFDAAEGAFADGGKQAMRTAEAGSILTDVPSDPEREWYTFSHWAKKVGDGYVEFDLADPITEDLTLYAQYTAATYTVTYSGYPAEGGTVSFGENSNELQLPAVSVEKYTVFGGWFYDSGFVRPAADGDLLPAEHVTLYAKIEAMVPVSQGKPVSLSENETTQEPNVLENLVDGNAGTRWAADGTVPLAAGGSDYADGPIELVVDLGASYRIDAVTLSWVRGGNNDRTFYYEFSMSEDGKTFGAPFAGYAEGDGAFGAEMEHLIAGAAAGRYFKLSVTGANQQTYLSIYELRVYGYALGESEEDYMVDHASSSVALLKDGMTVAELEEKLAPAGNFQSAAYIPVQGNDGVQAASGDVYRLIAASGRTIEYRIARARTVTFDFNDGATADSIVYVAEGAVVSPPAAAAPEGKHLAGWRAEGAIENWNFAENTVTEDVTLVAVWENVIYTITYHVGDGEKGDNPSSYTIDSSAIAFSDARMQYYDFEGWFRSYEEATGEYADPITGIPAGSTGDVVVYAKFTPSQYEIVYNGLRGAGHDNLGTISIHTDATLTPPADIEDAVFDGWYLDAQFTRPVSGLNADLLSALDGSGKLQLYAKWIGVYTITFESNGGGKISDIRYSEKSGSIALPTAVEREHYLFGGWYFDEELTQAVQSVDPAAGRDFTLYAKWTPVMYTLHFYVNGGSAVADVQGSYGSVFTAPAAPTREGYEFAGWFLDAQCTQAYSFDTAVSGDLSVYALWREAEPEEKGCGASAAGSAWIGLSFGCLIAVSAIVAIRKRKI